jgi:hypothetical protein
LPESAKRRSHLNLVDSSRRLAEVDPGTEVEQTGGWLLSASSPEHPVISNAAFRIDDKADPEEMIARARAFFGGRGRGFSLWQRGGVEEDRDLAAAAEAAGLQCVYEMPEMLLAERAEEPRLPAGAELRRLASAEEFDDYWRIAASSYTSLGFPPEIFEANQRSEGLIAPDAAAFVAYLESEPVSIAMTIVSHGIAGIYWVGSLEPARGKGLGRAVTAAATNAGFDLGADVASLQASPMGEPIYAAMGYETVFTYRLLMSSPP